MIKNIIFDLGGVLLEIDAQKTIDAFASLGWSRESPEDNSHNRYEIFENLETGSDSIGQFRSNLRKKVSGRRSDGNIDSAWNAMLIGFFPGITGYLQELKSRYNLFLLSNTNSLHQERFREIFLNQHGYPIENLFSMTFYSHEIGFRKPNPMAYLKVLVDASLIPENTLFVDDLKINTDAAEKLGMNVLNIKAGNLLHELSDYLSKADGGPID